MSSRIGPWQRALYLPVIILAWLAVLVVGGWLLGHLTRTLLLIGLSGVLAFALTPVANLLARWLPRPVAVGITYVLGVGVVLSLGALLVMTVAGQVGSLVARLPEYAREAQSLDLRLEDLLSHFGIPPSAVQAAQQQLLAQLQDVGNSVAHDALGLVTEVAGGVVDLVFVLILSVYLTANGPHIGRWLRREAPPGQQRHASFLVAVVNRVVGGYIRGTLSLAFLIGVLVGGGLAILGVQYAAMLGVLAFFMEFIPILGVFISGSLSVIIAFFQGWQRALVVLGYFVFVHVVEGDVVGPRIMGRAVGIHPAVGLIALVAGTELFGIWGALFAAPVAGLLQAIATAVWIELQGGEAVAVASGVAEREKKQVERRIGEE